jgi:uncharacterized membrane protein
MEQLQENWTFIVYVILAGIALGALLGLGILRFGIKRGKKKLGLIGLIVSVISGAISILLPLLVTIVFVFLIARQAPLDSTSVEPDDVAEANDNDSAL